MRFLDLELICNGITLLEVLVNVFNMWDISINLKGIDSRP